MRSPVSWEWHLASPILILFNHEWSVRDIWTRNKETYLTSCIFWWTPPQQSTTQQNPTTVQELPKHVSIVVQEHHWKAVGIKRRLRRSSKSNLKDGGYPIRTVQGSGCRDWRSGQDQAHCTEKPCLLLVSCCIQTLGLAWPPQINFDFEPGNPSE